MSHKYKLKFSLCILRLSIFVVMLMWTLDKFINPGHSAKIFESFYAIPGLQTSIMAIIGGLELALLAGFVLGVYKKWTYGLVLILHTVSTVSSYKQYLSPFEGPHLLFFAAWPMLAGCLMLYLLRDEDRWLSLGK